jgi:hypothetical protein
LIHAVANGWWESGQVLLLSPAIETTMDHGFDLVKLTPAVTRSGQVEMFFWIGSHGKVVGGDITNSYIKRSGRHRLELRECRKANIARSLVGGRN